MPVPPFTHHDIIRRTVPLTRSGLKVNLNACDKAQRYIEFQPQAGDDSSVSVIYSLEVDNKERQRLSRVLVHTSGLVSTLEATASNIESVLNLFEQIPQSRQLNILDDYTAAYSYSLTPEYGDKPDISQMQLRFVCAQVACIELRVDTSTGGGMPADVRVLTAGKASNYLPDSLADGGDLPLDHRAARKARQAALAVATDSKRPDLPEDLLAILGAQWRPLRFQGDHWKGVLRQLGNRDKRTQLAEKFIQQALKHLHTTLTTPPDQYQLKYNKARWNVYFRRLQPVMVFIGILALMPISWLFVSSGTMSIHPLALGLTPLLMVGVVVLTAREIPVMEIPSTPAQLPASAWSAEQNQQRG